MSSWRNNFVEQQDYCMKVSQSKEYWQFYKFLTALGICLKPILGAISVVLFWSLNINNHLHKYLLQKKKEGWNICWVCKYYLVKNAVKITNGTEVVKEIKESSHFGAGEIALK